MKKNQNKLASIIVAGAVVLLTAPGYSQTDATRAKFSEVHASKLRDAAEDKSIRPFHINVPEADLVDLRRRIVATSRNYSRTNFGRRLNHSVKNGTDNGAQRVLFSPRPDLQDSWERE